MFWRKLSGTSYEFVAIKSFRQIHRDKHLYEKCEYEFDLADGSKESTVFELEAWQRLEQGSGKGGVVVIRSQECRLRPNYSFKPTPLRGAA